MIGANSSPVDLGNDHRRSRPRTRLDDSLVAAIEPGEYRLAKLDTLALPFPDLHAQGFDRDLRREVAAMTPGTDPMPALKAPVRWLCEQWSEEGVRGPRMRGLVAWARS